MRNFEEISLKFRRFYTLIPQDFGHQKPPVIDDQEKLKEKLLLLEVIFVEISPNFHRIFTEISCKFHRVFREISLKFQTLQQMEIATELMKSEGGADSDNAIDISYKKLKTEIKPLDKNSETYKRLEQ